MYFLDKSKYGVSFNKPFMKDIKYYICLSALRTFKSDYGEGCLSLAELITACGYSSKSSNVSIYNTFKDILNEEVIEEGFAETNIPIMDLKPSTTFHIYFNREKDLFSAGSKSFMLLTTAEFEKIIECSRSIINISQEALLRVYMHIKGYIPTSSLQLHIVYMSQEAIAADLRMSLNTVKSCIKVLEENSLLYIRKDLFKKNYNGLYSPLCHVYATTEADIENTDNIRLELETYLRRKVFFKHELSSSEITYKN